MKAEKLIRNYFVFVMAVLAISTFTQFEMPSHYLTSVVHSSANTESLPLAEGFSLEIKNSPADTATLPGEKNKEIMQYVMLSKNYNGTLESLKLKLSGVHPLAIEKAYFMDGEKVISEGRRNDEYFVFSGLDYKMEKGVSYTLSLKLDVSEYLQAGQRIRFDIESADDFVLILNGQKVSISENYPVYGKYLSIVKTRKW